MFRTPCKIISLRTSLHGCLASGGCVSGPFIVNSTIRKLSERMKYTFERSPVTEVVLGVQYDRPVFSINDEVDIYVKFREDYPQIEEVPPLPSVIEAPDTPQTAQVLKNWASRKHFISPQRDRLVQIQPDRILFNWRKEGQQNNYPRFKVVLDNFMRILSVAEADTDRRQAHNQYEMSYIDHIPLKSFDLEYYDISAVFDIMTPGPSYKNISVSYSVAHEEVGGVLNSSIKSGLRRDTKERIFVFEATCRGFHNGTTVDNWFVAAHNLLLEHFHSIISSKAKSAWGFKEE